MATDMKLKRVYTPKCSSTFPIKCCNLWPTMLSLAIYHFCYFGRSLTLVIEDSVIEIDSKYKFNFHRDIAKSMFDLKKYFKVN